MYDNHYLDVYYKASYKPTFLHAKIFSDLALVVAVVAAQNLIEVCLLKVHASLEVFELGSIVWLNVHYPMEVLVFQMAVLIVVLLVEILVYQVAVPVPQMAVLEPQVAVFVPQVAVSVPLVAVPVPLVVVLVHQTVLRRSWLVFHASRMN